MNLSFVSHWLSCQRSILALIIDKSVSIVCLRSFNPKEYRSKRCEFNWESRNVTDICTTNTAHLDNSSSCEDACYMAPSSRFQTISGGENVHIYLNSMFHGKFVFLRCISDCSYCFFVLSVQSCRIQSCHTTAVDRLWHAIECASISNTVLD